MNEKYEYAFQAGRTVFTLNLQQEQSIFSFMKGNQAQSAYAGRPDNGEIILTKEGQQASL